MTSLARRILGPAYPAVVRTATSEPVRRVNALLGVPQYLMRRQRMNSTLAVDIQTRMGMGAVLSKALLFHELANLQGVAAEIYSSNSLYSEIDQTDFLETYFYRPSKRFGGKPIAGRSYLWALRNVAPQELSVRRASELFRIHFSPKDNITDRVSSVMNGRTNFDLSIHFRSTDKSLESGAPDTHAAIERISRYLDTGETKGVFLATDDMAFQNIITSRFAQHRFFTYNLVDLPVDTPRHFSNMTPTEKAIEALVNIFLLSRSPLIVRSSSYMSAISALVNPHMKTDTLNRTLTNRSIFPESQILAREDDAR